MFIKRMLELMKQQKITKKKIAADLGFGINQIKYWEDHGNTPSAETVNQIAEYLNCSVDYLLGKTDIKEKPGTDVTPTELSEDIKKLNEILKTLPPEKVKEIENYALFVSKQQNQ